MSNPDGARILYQKSGERVATLTLNRPEALNACTRAMWDELGRLWREIMADDAVRVVVLTGAGDRAFCAGVDLKELADAGPSARPFAPPPPLLENWDREFWKPIVCAINGLALGSGFSMLFATDVRIAAEHASFGLSQVKWGLVSGHATQLAPRFLAYPHAMELLLTGESISAQRAYEIGLVNRVVARTALMDEAMETARRIASHPPAAVQAIKEAAVRGLDLPLREAIVWGLRMERLCQSTQDGFEGPRSFAARRAPRWKADPPQG
jgi:enoyl-CoA hydratase/carnithine racemase